MKSVAEHVRDCRSLARSRPPVEVAPPEALGLRVAEAVRAERPYPVFVASAMDGYAVRVEDLPGELRVIGEVAAGQPAVATVEPHTAIRVMTGAPVPAGAEAVVPVEDAVATEGSVSIAVTTTAGRHIRGIGDDVRVGDTLVAAGQVIAAPQLAALVAHNVCTVRAHPRPRVAVISTGDELVPFGQRPGDAQLVDSNGPALAAAARAAGAEVVHASHVGDDVAEFVTALEALSDVDVVITSGGVSMGAYDVVKAALAERGVRFESVAMQPGKPQAWGVLPGGPAFLGLPGNPVSALVSFELFGRAALGRERTVARADLLDPVPRSPKGKRQFLRGQLRDGSVRLLGGPQSHLVAGLAAANCLVVVEEDDTELRAGASVAVVLLGD
jgi:molybdopterin molybdotransferase